MKSIDFNSMVKGFFPAVMSTVFLFFFPLLAQAIDVPTLSTQYCLTTSANPPEGGTVNPSGTHWYDSGQVVHISATANSGYTVSGCSGDLSVTATNPFITTMNVSITMNGNKNVTANFSVNSEWTLIDPPYVSSNWYLEGVHLTSSNEGWAVGEDFSTQGGVLLHYSNCSWTKIALPYVSSNWGLWDVYFTSSNEGWAVGEDNFNQKGVLLHYYNGLWTSVYPPYESASWHLNRVKFTSPDEGWAVGWDESNKQGVLLHYVNGYWMAISPPYVSSDWGLLSVHFTSPTEGWAVGRDVSNKTGVLLHYINGSWFPITLPPCVDFLGTCLDWTVWDVYFTSSSEGWAVGTGDSYPIFLHYSNGSWTVLSPSYPPIVPPPPPPWPPKVELYGVHLTSPTNGWAVGKSEINQGVLFHYSYGGWGWRGLFSGSPDVSSSWYLNSVHFSSSGEGWAVGFDDINKKGVLLKYFLPETVLAPSTPTGPTSGTTGTSYSYSTGASDSNLGHEVEYQFDWTGDGADLSPWGSATQSNIWTIAGTYSVRARARCATHNCIVSSWSGGLSVSIAKGKATRDLPDYYTPSIPLSVTITVTPGETTQSYAVEDIPPNGWAVTSINENGQWDNVNRKVKWGPFFDHNIRTLAYQVTPPIGETGTKIFLGTASFDGINTAIGGDLTVKPVFLHPADTSHDFRISISEVTAYGSAWKAGETWPVPPNPVPIAYVTNAGSLWKVGEMYRYDATKTPPLCWIPGAPAGSLSVKRSPPLKNQTSLKTHIVLGAGNATRDLPNCYTPSVTMSVSITVTPGQGTQVYAVEDSPPAGWTVSDINESGGWDDVNKKVKWGPFFDQNNRTLTYKVTPPSGETGAKTFSGTASFDGKNMVIGGELTLGDCTSTPLPDLTGSWTTPVTQTCKNTRKGPKCTIKGVLTINNNGNRDASSSTVKFYLSDSNTYDQGDTPLMSAATGKIKAKKSKSIKLSKSFPLGQIVTDKYIIAVIDKYNSVKEVDETNNVIVFGPIQ